MSEVKKRSRPPLVMRWGGRPDEGSEALKEQLAATNAELTATRQRLEALQAAHAQCEARMRELQERNTSSIPRAVPQSPRERGE